MKELRIDVLNFLAVGPSLEMLSMGDLLGATGDKPAVGDDVKFLLGVTRREDLKRSPLTESPFDGFGAWLPGTLRFIFSKILFVLAR